MQALNKLDVAILDGLFQPAADYVMDRWGKSCFWLARLLFWIVLALHAIGLAFYTRDDPKSWAIFLTFSAGGLFILYQWEIEDRKASAHNARAANWRRVSGSFKFWRITFFLTACFGWIIPLFVPYESLTLLIIGFSTGMWGCINFASCNPRPRKPLPARQLSAAPV